MNDKFILEGKKPVVCEDIMVWGKFMQDSNRIVKQENIGDTRISTVFLGLDHSFTHGGEPIIFETMIFGGEHDQYQDRCSTWEQAEKMHLKAKKLLKGGIKNE